LIEDALREARIATTAWERLHFDAYKPT